MYACISLSSHLTGEINTLSNAEYRAREVNTLSIRQCPALEMNSLSVTECRTRKINTPSVTECHVPDIASGSVLTEYRQIVFHGFNAVLLNYRDKLTILFLNTCI